MTFFLIEECRTTVRDVRLARMRMVATIELARLRLIEAHKPSSANRAKLDCSQLDLFESGQ
jgi:hypothetical protein